ncbi:hypothetical protein HDU87_000401 [Geranomyces variabilis]|uniref:Uncharacterized protein n=1 Tax=Geranomyces variabilis TaxID=109894 RepID=A0AAD5XPU2_9FUNG|nr:hypothetical protein HDU87_000401 [Geranomyces variabilis]
MAKPKRKRSAAAATGESGSKRVKTSCIPPSLAEALSLSDYWSKTEWRKWTTDGFAMLWTKTNPAHDESSLRNSLLSDLKELGKGLVGKTKLERVEKMITSLEKQRGSHYRALAMFLKDSFSNMVKQGRHQKKLFRQAVGQQGTEIMETAVELAGVEEEGGPEAEEGSEHTDDEAEEGSKDCDEEAEEKVGDQADTEGEMFDSTSVTSSALGQFMFGNRDLVRGLQSLANFEEGQMPTIESNVDVYL